MSQYLLSSPDGTEHYLADDLSVIEAGEGYEGWTHVGEGLPLDVRKEQMLARLKVLRDRHEFGLVTVEQGQLQIDEQSQSRLGRAAEGGRTYERLTGQPFSTEWRMFDNSWAPINLAVLDTWALLILSQVQHVFAHFGALFVAVMNATTTAELDALDVEVEAGWDVGAVTP